LKFVRPLCSASLAVLVALSTPAVQAADPPRDIRDEAHLFTEAGVSRAEEEIVMLRKEQQGFDLVIETLPALPEAERKRLQNLPARQANGYFHDLAVAHAEGVNGVFALVCPNPPRIEVVVQPPENEQRFSVFRTKQLKRQLGKAIDKSETPDRALLEAVAGVRNVLRGTAPNPNALDGRTLAALLVGGVGVWILLALWRRRVNPDSAPSGAARAALQAAQFGSLPAFAVYDQLFQIVRTTCPPPPPPPVPEPLQEQAVDEPTDVPVV
jgi:hypothetical protein